MRKAALLSTGVDLCSISLLLMLVTCVVLAPGLPISSQAQAAGPITSSGLNTQVNTAVTLPTGQTQYDITGGTRPGGGTSLFHSFGDFNVPTNNIANFLNGVSFDLAGHELPAGLQTANILARVTDGNLSNIFGTIQTTDFGNANLFFMNPAGFLFGPNATVNIGGMMTFTTANYLRLEQIGSSTAGVFHADPAQVSVLTASPVTAFGFLGSNPGAMIAFEGGQLTIASGTAVALVGGNINLVPDSSGTASGITAHGRPTLLTSVAGPGEIAADTGVPAPGMTLGTITLGQGTTLDTSGDPSLGDGSGGAVSIRGGQLVATGATILTNPSFDSAGQGGAVTVTASDTASFTNSTIDTSAFPANGVSQNAGAINVTASRVSLEDSTFLTEAFGDGITAGSGGAVTLTATDTAAGIISLVRSSIRTDTFFADGNGGTVSMTAPTVSLENSRLDASVSGDGIDPITGTGGAVMLAGTTGSVSLTRSAISTESFDTAGNSGSIMITAPTVTMIGTGVAGDGVGLNASTHNSSGDPTAGNGGDIEITATNVTLTNGAAINSFADSPETFSHGGTIRIAGSENILIANGTRLMTTTTSQAPSGDIELLGQQVAITQSELFSQTLASGASGTIMITGTGDIALTSGSVISTSAGLGSDGSAGAIGITTPHLTITGGSQLASETFGSGPGGNITIQDISGPAQSVLINGPGSGIFSDTLSTRQGGNILGTGVGGNIFIHANSVMLQNGGTLSAKTSGVGNAGDILVKADSMSITGGAQLTSSSSIRQTPFFPGDTIPSPTGKAGNVTIQGLASPSRSVLIDGVGSGVFTDTQGTGAGGNISVNANSVMLQNGGTLSAKTSGTEAAAIGGSIAVTATSQVTLTNGASVSASSSGPGNAGNIIVNAGQNYTSTDSAVTTKAAQASGGNITVNATNMVQLTNSQLNASVQGSSTTVGGNITIDPQYVILQNSQILAQATQGQGGAITIAIANGGLFLPDANSVISASSQFGQNGTITIQSPNAPVSGQIQPLNKTPLIATSLLNQHCAALADGKFSSFTVAGRDSLPTEPGGWLSSPLAMLSTGTGRGVTGEGLSGSFGLSGAQPTPLGLNPTNQINQTNQKDQINQTNPTLLSLRQIAPAGFLTQAFAVDRATGCKS